MIGSSRHKSDKSNIRVREMTLQRFGDGILVGFFALAIATPVGVQLVGANTRKISENRLLAERPAWPSDCETLAAFPARFEAYFNDHFGFRDTLIRWHNYAMVRWLGTSPSPQVVVGRQGWLYFAGEHSIDDYR